MKTSITHKLLAGLFLLGFSICSFAQNYTWGRTDYQGNPWVSNASRPYTITKGLNNRHLSIGTSHGRYYAVNKEEWQWQRPRLYTTIEDLFTQTFTVPYIIPMLERAGAIVYTPRERDWQRNEAVVDNDGGIPGGHYQEQLGKRKWQTSDYAGFAHLQRTYLNGENPFIAGTARICPTIQDSKHTTTAQWVPMIPERGSYAVYVSYQSFQESATDASYTVYHLGGTTEFKVNQQMGGGTWVYLGTFEFEKGESNNCKVVLSNYSQQKGVVTADGVRFGGGMGNIARGANPATSGLPRYLEGARYNAQWSGFPPEVYNMYEGEDDYKDDINTRSFSTNYLMGGSVYCPDSIGLHVPIEAQLSFHSDAGYTADSTFVGPITICSTENDSIYDYPGGISRMVSLQLANDMLYNACNDLSRTFGIDWPAREVRDRNYSESRRAHVPSLIFEMLSHQNWADLRFGMDPTFKFALARSIYKTILRFVNRLHGTEAVVAPLPVRSFAINRKDANTIHLSWQPTTDLLELKSNPTSYVIYTRLNNEGFDNGRVIKGNKMDMDIIPGTLYSFKVTALNDGGESLDSEVLSAYIAPNEHSAKETILVVNGFNRLCGPRPIYEDDAMGYDILSDAGVSKGLMPGFAGAQQVFSKKKIGKETSDGTGFTGQELEGKLIMGNTFDYPYLHGLSIQAAGGYSFVSASKEACEAGFVDMNDYALVDLILGLEKNDGWSLTPYKTFSEKLQRQISRYMDDGGRILVSGAYLASDMLTEDEARFTHDVLKYNYDATLSANSSFSNLTGCGLNFNIPRQLNEKQYAVQSCDCLIPADGAFASFAYLENNRCAGIAYQKKDYRVMALGFPFESITGEKERHQIMGAMLQFLLK